MTEEEIRLWRYSREGIKSVGICPLTPCFLVSSPKWSSATLDFWFFIIVHPPVLDKFFHLLTVGSLCYELNILTFMVVILSPVYTIPYSFTLCLHFILFKNLLLKWLTYSIVFLVYCKVIQLYLELVLEIAFSYIYKWLIIGYQIYSLRCTAGPCCLPVLYILVCIC